MVYLKIPSLSATPNATARHPGVVLDAVPAVDHPACLGWQWFRLDGASALLLARRHEASNGLATSEPL